MAEVQTYRWYKVVRISRVYAETKKDALKAVQEDVNYQNLVVEFAKEDGPTGFLGAIKRQLLG